MNFITKSNLLLDFTNDQNSIIIQNSIFRNKNLSLNSSGKIRFRPFFFADLNSEIRSLNTDLIKEFNSDRVFNIIEKPKELIGSFKAYKEESGFHINGEFHSNFGVLISNYDKLLAHFPWGPMSPLKFQKQNQ